MPANHNRNGSSIGNEIDVAPSSVRAWGR
jgi:hypothetical protein